MEEFTIYYGTPQGEDIKIGVDCNYPARIKVQKIQDGQVLEVHTCVYEVSRREMELQREYGVKVDNTPYHVTYFRNKVPPSTETRNKLSAAATGKTSSEETKAKISASLIGNTNALGNIHTEEVKAKISASLIGNTNSLGRVNSEEHNANISAGMKGIVFSTKHKDNLRGPKPKLQCPHCEMQASATNMSRHIKARH